MCLRVWSQVRIGDVFALLVEFYHNEGNMQQAYVLIEKMQERKIIINPYLDSELVEQVRLARHTSPHPSALCDSEQS